MLIHPMPDPVAFSIGPLHVHWYGLMYVLAFAMWYWRLDAGGPFARDLVESHTDGAFLFRPE